MRIIIDIPKEFENHFSQDRFKDSLQRLAADAHLLAGNYEKETAEMLVKAFENSVPLSPFLVKFADVIIDAADKQYWDDNIDKSITNPDEISEMLET